MKTHLKSRVLGVAALLSMPLSLLLAAPANAYSAFDANSPYLFGDWNGQRTALEKKGITFNFGYTGEAGYLIKGGYTGSHKLEYADQFTVGANFDLEKLFGIPGGEFQATLINRNGNSIDQYINNPNATINTSSVQEIYGNGSVTRPSQFWYRQHLLNDRLTIKLGRIPVDDDFGSINSNFQNNTFGGAQVGNWGNDVFNSPISQWAAVVKYQVTPEIYGQIGVFDVNKNNLPNGNAWQMHVHGSDGTMIPAEVGYTPTFSGMPGAYRLGYYHNNTTVNAYGLADLNATTDKSNGIYYVVQQQVTKQKDDDNRGLTLFSMGMTNWGHSAGVDRYLSVGATYQGLFDARPQDDIGFGLSYLHVNPDVNKNIAQMTDTLAPIQGHQFNAELYYGFHLMQALTLRPNIQYVVNPSADNTIKNAWVAGLQLQASF